MRTVKHFTRGNLPKPKTYKLRNYRPAEVIENSTTVQQQNKLPAYNKNSKVIIQKTQDTFDFSGEEHGFYKLGKRIIKTIFPR